MKIGILGGGITGLSLGYFFKDSNIDFEILEKESECGGLCKTIKEDGFTFDYGGHIVWSKDKEILDFLLSLLSNNVVKNKRNTKILYKNSFIKYPFENGLKDLTVEERFECLIHFINILLRKERGEKEEPTNFEEWVYLTFGKAIAEKYLIPYNKKVWNIDLKDIGLNWIKIKDRLPQPNPEDIIRSALGIETEGYKSQLFFYYPREGGIQSISKSIENKIGKRITRNFEINKIIKKQNKWVISNGLENKEFNELISTIPIIDLISTLDNVPNYVKKAANDLKYNSLILVMIGLDVDNLTDKHWIYIPDMNIKTHKVIFPKSNNSNVTPKGKSSIMAEITCKFKDDFWNQDDKEIIKEIVDGLYERDIINKNRVCYTKVVRIKYAYVIHDLHHSKNLEIVRNFLEGLGIKLCGRFSEFKYLNLDACIRSAMELAKGYQ